MYRILFPILLLVFLLTASAVGAVAPPPAATVVPTPAPAGVLSPTATLAPSPEPTLVLSPTVTLVLSPTVTLAPPAAPNTPAPTPTELVVPAPAGAILVADSLLQPRGLDFGPDGSLYIAEAGIAPPPGQNSANTGRLTKIAPDGTRTVLLDKIATTGSEFNGALGASATAIISDTLYLAAAGPDGGRGNAKSGIYLVKPDGTTELIADLGQFNDDNKPAIIDSDYDRANPYDMVALNGKLYIADGNIQVINEVDPLAPQGQNARRVADMSRGHPVLTGIVASKDGNLYVTQFTHGPYTEAFTKGVAQIFRVTLDGQVTPVASGITMALGLAQSPDGTFYASQFASNLDVKGNFTAPGSIVKLREGDSETTTVIPNLAYPTGVEWGPDGYLYFAIYGITIPSSGQQRGAVYKIKP